MRLTISNLNIVGNADISINGLAVIAGENGTGKSTIGKTLFATIKALAAARGSLSDTRVKAINDLADPIFSRLFRLRHASSDPRIEAAIPTSRALFLNEIMRISSTADLQRYFNPIITAITDDTARASLIADINLLADSISRPADSSTALASTLTDTLRSEFLGNISSDSSDGPTVTFSDDSSDLDLSYSITAGNASVDLYSGSTALRDATYIESPLYLHLIDILAKVAGARFFQSSESAQIPLLPAHVADIVEKIESLRYITDMPHTQAPQLSATLSRLAGGEFFYDPARHVIMFRQGDNNIVPLNVASGVKSLGLLQLLLDNRIVTPDRPLIWDEPENHLHPSWQIRLAQFLVMLASQGIPVIVSTHSPYFIQGIRYFAVKLHAEQFVDYYLTEMQPSGPGTSNPCSLSVTGCVNDDLNSIFIKLAAPLREIMDLP